MPKAQPSTEGPQRELPICKGVLKDQLGSGKSLGPESVSVQLLPTALMEQKKFLQSPGGRALGLFVWKHSRILRYLGHFPSPEAIPQTQSLRVALVLLFFQGGVVPRAVNCRTGRGSDTRQRY